MRYYVNVIGRPASASGYLPWLLSATRQSNEVHSRNDV